jgi:hypothetical protein
MRRTLENGATEMKTINAVLLAWTLTLAALVTGCVVHDHGHYGYYGTRVSIASGHVCTASCDHYHYGGYWYRVAGHVHGPGCGHVLRSGIWVTVR